MVFSNGREKSDVRRQQIVRAAMDLLADFPLSQLSTRRIAASLGISQPALFRHFRSREDILVEVVSATRSDLAAVAEALLATRAEAPALLAALATELMRHVAKNPGLPRLLFANVASGEGAVLAAIRQLHSMQLSMIAELVRQGQREGSVDPSIGARDAALMFVGFMQSATLARRLDPRDEPLEAEGQRLFELWMRAVSSRAEARPAAALAEPAPTEHATLASLRVLDVRPLLQRGVDPLDTVLETIDGAGPGGVVKLSVPFRPAPLIALLGSRGHSVRDARVGPKDWAVEILCAGAPAPEDLTDLEAPEPLERVLRATSQLAPGQVYLARLPRNPRLLLPRLEERGLRWSVFDEADGTAFLQVVRPT
jgi:AcrR family transcriptional regulator